MKRKLIPLILTVVLFASHSSGQDNRVRSGIGVGIISSGASIYFPIITGRNFRIEPELGLMGSPDEILPASKDAPLLIRLGVGLFYPYPLRGYNNAYFGPGVARIASSVDNLFWSDVGSKTLRTGYLIGVCGGLEVGSSHFAIAFELGLESQRL
ncbi:MAG: hypothetical protein ACP5JH_11855 [Bacteroidota bacterium]